MRGFPRIVLSGRVRLSFLFAVLWVLAAVFKPWDIDRRTLMISDEALHVYLAKQLSVDLSDYNPQKANLFLVAQGKPQHAYMRAPLYKHPPLYALLLSLPFRFGYNSFWSNYFAFWLASLAPLLVYLWARTLFDGRVAFVAGCLMLIDPLFWMASLRIIMDPLLAILMNAALFAYARSADRGGPYWRLFGLTFGLALLTKYPAVLVAAVVFVHLALERPQDLRRPGVYVGLAIAAAMFVPWMIWNIRVYGNFWKITAVFHGYWTMEKVFALLRVPWAVMALAVLLAGLLALAARGVFARAQERWTAWRWSAVAMASTIALCLMASGDLRWALYDTLSLFRLPAAQLLHRFSGPPSFFAIQLLRMSPFYILGFLSVGLWRSGRPYDRLLMIAAAAVLAFYWNWQDRESRYILPAVLPLMILAARVTVHLWDETSRLPRGWKQGTARAAWVAVVFFFTVKTLIVDARLAMAIAGPSFFFY